MRFKSTLLLLLFTCIFAANTKAQTAWKLDVVTENFEIFWAMDSHEELIRPTDTLSLDADYVGTDDVADLAVKWYGKYLISADITLGADPTTVDWNNDGVVDFANSWDSTGPATIGGPDAN